MKYFVTLVQGSTYHMDSREFVKGVEAEVPEHTFKYAQALAPLFTVRKVDEPEAPVESPKTTVAEPIQGVSETDSTVQVVTEEPIPEESKPVPKTNTGSKSKTIKK